jgi:hypothetical protein
LGHQISDHRVQCIESWHDGVKRHLGGCLRKIKLVEPRVGRSNRGIHPLIWIILMSVTRTSISACMSCSCFLSLSPAMVSTNTKQKGTPTQGGTAHKGTQTIAVIRFLSVLTTHTAAACNQPVEFAKYWRRDCLEKQNLLVVEIRGVLGWLHSSQGLAHSNNKAKLNDSAKHETNAVGNKWNWKDSKEGGEGVANGSFSFLQKSSELIIWTLRISNSKIPHKFFPKLSLSRVRPNSKYGTRKERWWLDVRGDGSMWEYVARPGRDSYQGMHSRAQKACEPRDTVAQNSFTEMNRFPFPTWAVWRSLFFWILFLFLFDCFPSFFFSLIFIDLSHHGTGMGRPRGG